MTQATQSQMNEFVAKVDEFMRKYQTLTSDTIKQKVYASGDSQLIADYEKAVYRGGLLKSNIEAVTGAWAAAKNAYATVTDYTSTVIGDAIDEIRSWFTGGDGNLGAIQIPAAAWVIATIGAAASLVISINAILVRIEASELQKQNPNMSRERALQVAKSSVGLGGAVSALTQPMLIAAAAFIAWLWLSKK